MKDDIIRVIQRKSICIYWKKEVSGSVFFNINFIAGLQASGVAYARGRDGQGVLRGFPKQVSDLCKSKSREVRRSQVSEYRKFAPPMKNSYNCR